MEGVGRMVFAFSTKLSSCSLHAFSHDSLYLSLCLSLRLLFSSIFPVFTLAASGGSSRALSRRY